MMDPSRVALRLVSRNRTSTPLVNGVEFSLQLGSGQDAGGISLHFEGDGWKLSGIRLPSAVLDALSRQLPAG